MRLATLLLVSSALACTASRGNGADFGVRGNDVTFACRVPTTARAFGVNTYYDDKIVFTVDYRERAVLDESGTPMRVLSFRPDEIAAIDSTGRTLLYDPPSGEITASRYFLPGGEIVGLGRCNRVRHGVYK